MKGVHPGRDVQGEVRNDPRQGAQRSKAKCATMYKVKCATMSKAKCTTIQGKVCFDVQGKGARNDVQGNVRNGA
jgi:hypothetical protein